MPSDQPNSVNTVPSNDRMPSPRATLIFQLITESTTIQSIQRKIILNSMYRSGAGCDSSSQIRRNVYSHKIIQQTGDLKNFLFYAYLIHNTPHI